MTNIPSTSCPSLRSSSILIINVPFESETLTSNVIVWPANSSSTLKVTVGSIFNTLNVAFF